MSELMVGLMDGCWMVDLMDGWIFGWLDELLPVSIFPPLNHFNLLVLIFSSLAHRIRKRRPLSPESDQSVDRIPDHPSALEPERFLHDLNVFPADGHRCSGAGNRSSGAHHSASHDPSSREAAPLGVFRHLWPPGVVEPQEPR